MNKPQLLMYALSPKVTAFSSMRHGGYSQGNYGEFNVNLYCGDNAETIAKNREALCQLLDIKPQRLLMPHQTHSDHVVEIGQDLLEMNEQERAALLEGTDALMTQVRGVCIGVSTADCIPVLLYDEAHHAAAAIHAGWRGTVKRIVKKTVEAMGERFGTSPEELKAVVGPGISLKVFEVGDEVYEQFQDAGFPMAQIARRYAKWHIDLPACNRLLLEETGVHRIEMSGICTYQQSGDYFSARKLGVDSGRILTGIVLR